MTKGPMGEGDIVEALESLRSKDLVRRLTGLAKIVEEGGKEKLPILIEALQDQSWHLRAESAKAIVKEGPRAVPRLLKLLEGGVWYVRAISAQVLGEIGDERALSPLIRLIGDGNDTVRRNAKEALRRIFEVGAVARLAVAVRECSPGERETALKLLSAVDPIKAEMMTTLKEEATILVDEEAAPKPAVSEEDSTAEVMRKLRKVLQEMSSNREGGEVGKR